MDPSIAVQVTAVLEVPVTVAANCFDWPDCSAKKPGDTEIPTVGVGVGGGVFSALAVPITGISSWRMRGAGSVVPSITEGTVGSGRVSFSVIKVSVPE